MKTRFLSIICILLLSAAANAEEKNSSKKILTYEDFIQRIESSLPEIKSNSVTVLKAENETTRAKSAGDISLSAGFDKYSGKQYLSGTGDKGDANGYNLSAGVEKKIISTGTSLSTTYKYSKNSYSGFSLKDDYNTYEPSLSFKVSQPLLYNFLGKVDKYTEKNADMQLAIERLRLKENNKSVLNAYKKLYFEWIACSEIVSNLEKAVENSRKLRDQTQRKVRAGLADNDDYQKTVTSYLAYKSQHTDYKKTLKTIGNRLSVYFDVTDYSPSKDNKVTFFLLASECAYDRVDFKKTTSSKIIDETMKNYQYSRGVYENRLLPRFNVFAEYARKDTSESSSPGMNDTDYSIGFEFTYKLGNNEAKSALKDVELEMKSLRHEFDAALRDYTKQILNYRESALGSKELINIAASKYRALASQLKTERKKYSQARLNLSYLIETQNSITSVETDIINYRYQLICNYIDYLDLIN